MGREKKKRVAAMQRKQRERRQVYLRRVLNSPPMVNAIARYAYAQTQAFLQR